MDIRQIFDLGIKMGIEADLRSKAFVEKELKRTKAKYEKLSVEEKKFFDKEKLTNPFSDSRIQNNNGIKNVKRILAGIDIDSAELMIARYLSNHDPKKPIDLVLAHHPLGMGTSAFAEVMEMQAEILNSYGVPINVAEGLLKPRIQEVNRSATTDNSYKEVDTAKLLDINLMNIHTPMDNLVANYLKNYISKKRPEFVEDILNILMEIPEYQEAARRGMGPSVWVGSKENRVGKIAFTEITGGTGGSHKVYEKMINAGIGTIIGMHIREESRKEAEKHHINVVIAGHISSDSLGMNLFLDELERKGIEIIPCSGLTRFSRIKKK
jgi:putative NIF3 family GTP cyclohydrolase 1 type 2